MVNIYINEQLVESFHFPVTDVGDSSTVSVLVKNPLKDPVELIPFSNDPDVEIESYPRTLQPMESAIAVWKFSPKANRLTPLKNTTGFREIVG